MMKMTKISKIKEKIMMKKTRFTTAVIAITLLISIISAVPVSASVIKPSDVDFSKALYPVDAKMIDTGVSSWAEAVFDAARSNALIPAKISGIEAYSDILTSEILSFLAVNTYQRLVPGYALPEIDDKYKNPYTDLHKVYDDNNYYPYYLYPLYAAELQLMSGVSATKFSPDAKVTREHLSSVVVNLLRAAGVSIKDAPENTLNQFADKNNISGWAKSRVAYVVANGYMSGVTAKEFKPQDAVTVEQAIAALVRVYQKTAKEVLQNAISITSHKENAQIPRKDLTLMWSGPKDSESYTVTVLSQYGSQYIYGDIVESAKSGGNKITIPYDDLSTSYYGGWGWFSDTSDAENKEFYIVISDDKDRFSKPLRLYFESSELIISDVRYENSVKNDGSVTLEWLPVNGASDYTVSASEMRRECAYDELMPANPNVGTYKTNGLPKITLNLNSNRYYHITVTSSNGRAAKLLLSVKDYRQAKKTELTQDDMKFPDSASAQKKMKTIKIDVWKIDGKGNKYAATANLTVHEKVAGDVAAIFKEIYEGPEKFPIKDIGGFSWRGNDSPSMHSSGLAIDINSNENFCTWLNVGSFWKPYENPYSITPYGDVVRAFERHGWGWLNNDYMHFSVNGVHINPYS